MIKPKPRLLRTPVNSHEFIIKAEAITAISCEVGPANSILSIEVDGTHIYNIPMGSGKEAGEAMTELYNAMENGDKYARIERGWLEPISITKI